jgi:hypothetical protein
MKKLLPLILFFILILTDYANGQVTWVGDVSFNVEVTGLYDDSSGNEKFDKVTDGVNGKIYIIIEDGVPIKNPDNNNYYIEIRDEGGNTVIGIKEFVAIATRYVKLGKSDQFMLVGTGDLFDPITRLPGIAYIDSTGTLKEDKLGNMTSISISGKIGGGLNSEGLDNNYIFSANLKSVLTKE